MDIENVQEGEDDDEITLQMRPASFAAPPSASSTSSSSKYYDKHQQYQLQAPSLADTMDVPHLSNTSGSPVATSQRQKSPHMGSQSHTSNWRDPTPSTSRLPYDSSVEKKSLPQYTYNASASSSQPSQYQHYQQVRQASGQQSASTTRNRQDSGGSGGSTSSPKSASRFMHSTGNGVLQSSDNNVSCPQGRERLSGSNTNESAATSSSLLHPSRQSDNSSQGSSISSSSQIVSRVPSAEMQQAPRQGRSNSSVMNSAAEQSQQQQQQPPAPASSHRRTSQLCAKCNSPMTGQFVRALGTVFHLDCFRCQVCLPSFSAEISFGKRFLTQYNLTFLGLQ